MWSPRPFRPPDVVPVSGIVIVGAGECGIRAAFSLRERGYHDPVTVIGTERHLPYERPPLSKGTADRAKAIAGESAYGAAGIELVRGDTVVAIDRHAATTVCASGRTMAFDRLLLATGARPRVLPGIETVATLRTLDDARAIFGALDGASRFVIIGGGFIGLECAAAARRLGASVTVIEAAPRLMGRIVPAAIADIIAQRHCAEGVELLAGETVTAADAAGVTLADGPSGPARRLDADLVIAGVGAVPETRLAEGCGLAVNNGILVDDTFRTTDPRIFAAGDCCRFPYRSRPVRLESWRAARDQAEHAAGALMGDTAPYTTVPWFWSDQFDLTLQVAGLPDPRRDFAVRPVAGDAALVFQAGDDGSLAAACGVGPGNAIARDIKIAERIIERNRPVAIDRLCDPDISLKSLLKE